MSEKAETAVPQDNSAWPALPLAAWGDTYATLHMWTQIVGKIRLEQSPKANHWWQVTLYVTARGLTTSTIPYGERKRLSNRPTRSIAPTSRSSSCATTMCARLNAQRSRLAAVAALAVLMIMVLLAGQVLAQTGTSTPARTGTVASTPGSGMGMMGLWTPPSTAPAVTEQQARTNAQAFLALKFPGATLAPSVTAFPGFYGLSFLVNGQPAGMLSVNAFSGQMWYHTWHGQFLSERTL